MTWTLTSDRLDRHALLQDESLFFQGNGYLGVRGNFEEGYRNDFTSIRGTYINAFHDSIEISYGEKLYGFPETQQKLVNMIDAQGIQILLGDETFSLFEGKILSYNRVLHMDRGFVERNIHWVSPKGKEIKISFKRVVSFSKKELFSIELTLDPIEYQGEVTILSTINGNVENFTDPNDPRLASGHAKRTSVIQASATDDISSVSIQTNTTKLIAACAAKHSLTVEYTNKHSAEKFGITSSFTFTLNQKTVFTKTAAFCDTLRHKEQVEETARSIVKNAPTFKYLLKTQHDYLNEFWNVADVRIGGSDELQEGIRFNLYHLLQSAGRDSYSNIAAKGLSGEGYEGHYFWDTEIYMLPVFLLTKPDIAKNLLLYRYHILDGARAHAQLLGHKKGALFPWRTISGTECSAYYPSGSAQYHISADVAYSFIQYYLATNDYSFMEQYGAEMLFETARLWNDVGQIIDGRFVINDVTGPDEYTCIVNNNYYTNAMAKYNLHWAVKMYALLKQDNPQALEELCNRIGLSEAEVKDWEFAAEHMYLPYNEKLDVNPQDDSFFQKAVWDFDNTPEEHYPLLLHYHPLTLYRYQVCKQADTILGHFLLEDGEKESTIKNSFDYYEKITTHDSSLSHCIFSIMASKVGYEEKAYQYFIETARLDLDNTHGNTKDGLHMANMGGTWMAIVFGFAGLRIKETGLELSPQLPKEWTDYEFSFLYKNRSIKVQIKQEEIRLSLTEGEPLELSIYGQTHLLTDELTVTN